MTSKVTLTGSQKKGWILVVQDKRSYQDMALEHCDLKILLALLKKKVK